MTRVRQSSVLVLMTLAMGTLVADTLIMCDGRRHLGINDDNLQDNSSAFRVAVSY